jgi:hypothetical protein
MKRTAISMALLLSALVFYAQGPVKGTLEFSLGPAFPMADFGNNQVLDEESGFAENGFFLAISFKYRLKAHLGLVATISGNFLPVNETGVANRYGQPGYGFNWTVESTKWISNAYLAGLDIILPIYRADFHFRLLGGLASTWLPGLSGSAFNFQREVSNDIAAAWSVGAGLDYQAFDKVTLSFGFDFFVSNPVLDEIWSSDLTSGTGKIYRNIVIINLKAGLGFRLF